MDSDRWQRLEALFHDALEVPPEKREEYLRAVEPDRALREEVLRLLAADADPGTLEMDVAARLGLAASSESGSSPEGASSLEGRRIGPYRVIRRIGEGGMGAVYLAERDDVDRQVALKLVRGALGAPELVQRFLRERRLLARLDHPNIARFLDAGMTEDETPYFAMEYVEGEPITEYCLRADAPERERLRLFRDVCAAVSYAHGSLVVHRDIKPSNVMVTGAGTVKLLDFGIAKLLGDDDDATLTRTGARVMSPAYAAPEQVRGEPVTTATDVYALGVLLRELLTGAREPGAGAPLSGDLQAICLRAAAPEPERRYTSADQLGADIGRYLGGLPVEARLPTLRYRAGKFLRRHAAGVVVAAVIVLSLGGGLGAALWQGRRAERARDQAEAARQEAETALSRSETVTGFLTDLFRAADPRESRGEEVTAVDLVDRGVERIDQLNDDPPLQARLLETLASVNMQLGRYPEAEQMMQRAVAIRRDLPPDTSLISALNVWGWTIDRLGLPDSSAVVWEEALHRGTELFGAEQANVIAARANLAVAYGRLGRDREAEELLRQVVELDQRVLDPDDPDRTSPLNNLGIQLTTRGAYDEADPLLRESLRIHRAVYGDDSPSTGMAMDNLGMMLREAGRYDEAEPLLRKGMEIRRQALGPDHRFFGESLFALGTLLALRAGPGDLEEADSLLHRGLDIFVATLGPDHRATAYIFHSLGILAERRGDLATAEARYRQALDIRRGSSHDSPMVTVQTMTALADVLRRRGSTDEALSLAREAVALAEERLDPDHPVRAAAGAQLAVVLAASAAERTGPGTGAGTRASPGAGASGEVGSEAERRFRNGMSILVARVGPDHPTVRRLCQEARAVGVTTAGLEVCR